MNAGEAKGWVLVEVVESEVCLKGKEGGSDASALVGVVVHQARVIVLVFRCGSRPWQA